jgi:flavorubredoxin
VTVDDERTLPREIAPGVFWLGNCLHLSYRGQLLHSYNSVYLVVGEESCSLVEAGHPLDLSILEAQLDGLLARGLPPLRHVFVTHHETPHSSGLGRILERFPEVEAIGGTQDLHLVFPQYADRIHITDPGDRVDLGGTGLVTVEAVIRDFAYTRWALDTARGVLFPGDGFAYAHYHGAGQCGALAEEAGDLDVPDMAAMFAEVALYWTRFVEIEPYIARLDRLVEEVGVKVIAPTHGLPITDVDVTLAKIRDGLRIGAARTDQAQVI